MAKNKSTVYLGYDDEEISDKHVDLLNSTVNKIGGNPVRYIALIYQLNAIDFSPSSFFYLNAVRIGPILPLEYRHVLYADLLDH